MAVLLQNTGAGGTNAATPTQGSGGNTGGNSGDYFDVVNKTGTGAALVFDNTVAPPVGNGMPYKWTSGTASSTFDLEWTTQLAGAPYTTLWFRLYLYVTALPTASIRVFTARNNAGAANCGSLQIVNGSPNTGKLRWLNSAGSTIVTSSSVLATASWARAEGFITTSATVGQVELKTFLTAQSTTPSDTQTSAATQSTSTGVDQWWWGDHAGTTSQSYRIYGMAVSSSGYIGPVTTAQADQLIVPGAAAMRAANY